MRRVSGLSSLTQQVFRFLPVGGDPVAKSVFESSC